MTTHLGIGYLSTLYHTSHLLRKRNWVEQELGIGCRWHLCGTGPEMIQAFEQGVIDLGYIGLPPAMIGISRGIPLVCVAGGHVEGTVMVAGPEYNRLEETTGIRSFLEQFDNGKVGIPAAGSIHDVIFRSLLQTNAATKVEITNFAWADIIPYAFHKGELVGATGTPPLAVLCERECGTRIVIPPAKLWPFNPSYGIVVRRELLKERKLVEGFLQLHEKACNLIREFPDIAAQTTVQALPGMNEAFVKKVYAVSPRYCSSLPDAYIKASLDFVPVIQRLGYMGKAGSMETVFETELIQTVHPEPHHY